ncbi:MAG TPA: hypothetical protein PLL76_18260 [Thermoanaerobaculia bacterium]|nr:hypothetical protein [Thermoanaerobaculia bacterium]
MTETQEERAPSPDRVGGTASHLDARRVPIHLTASPDLVDLALAYVADGSISDPATPALLRRIAAEHLAANEAPAAAIECPTLVHHPITEGFVLVDCEIRPGVRGYRLAKLPANVSWRISIGAFERNVHRTLVIFVRRLVRFLAARMALAAEWKVGLFALRAQSARRDSLGHLRERTSP